MKIKGEFVLRMVAGEIVALPYSGVTNLDMMITLNETGKFLWEKLVPGAEREELIGCVVIVSWALTGILIIMPALTPFFNSGLSLINSELDMSNFLQRRNMVSFF